MALQGWFELCLKLLAPDSKALVGVKVVLVLSVAVDTMSDRKSSKETQAEIDALADQLADTLRLETEDLTRQAEEGEAKCQALLRRMAGRPIIVAKKDDPLCGVKAVITGPRSKSKKPMCWWFRTTTGIEAQKAKTSFKLLPDEEEEQLVIMSQTELRRQQWSSCRRWQQHRLWQPRHVSDAATARSMSLDCLCD